MFEYIKDWANARISSNTVALLRTAYNVISV